MTPSPKRTRPANGAPMEGDARGVTFSVNRARPRGQNGLRETSGDVTLRSEASPRSWQGTVFAAPGAARRGHSASGRSANKGGGTRRRHMITTGNATVNFTGTNRTGEG